MATLSNSRVINVSYILLGPPGLRNCLSEYSLSNIDVKKGESTVLVISQAHLLIQEFYLQSTLLKKNNQILNNPIKQIALCDPGFKWC